MTATATIDPYSVQGHMQKYGVLALYNGADPLMEKYAQIAGTYTSNKTPKGFHEFIIACLMARSVLYYHKAPGDCGDPASYSPGLGTQVSKFGSLGASTAGTGLSVAAVAGGLTASAAAEAATIVGLAVLPFTVWGIFSAHHAAAVAKEQTVLCAASVQANALMANIDAAVANGSMSATLAVKALTDLFSNASQYISQVRQDCNAGCVITKAIAALVDLRKYLYQPQGTPNGSGGITTPVQAAQAMTQSNGVVYAAAAAAAAHFAGAI